MSRSPSLSMSATYTERAPSALVSMSAAVQDGLAAPSFSYHAMVSSSADADTMSRSPSPSMSATKTERALEAFVAMSAAAHVGLAAPSFSYHAMVSSTPDAETMSRSPSPSMSATTTEYAPSAEVAMSAAVHDGLAMVNDVTQVLVSVCSYHAMVSSLYEAEMMSRSPSPSMSATYTEAALSAEVEMSAAVHEGLAAPSFSYQAMVSSEEDADTMSRSPSPSMSATYTE